MTVLLKYVVKVPPFLGAKEILEMLRYSKDVVWEIKSTNPLIFVVMHEISGNRIKERLKFFRDHIIGRWKSFGFEIELTEDAEFLLEAELEEEELLRKNASS